MIRIVSCAALLFALHFIHGTAFGQELPRSVQQVYNDAVTAYEQERYLDTIRLLEEFLEFPVQNSEPWSILISSHAALYDFEAAGNTAEKALERFPGNPALLIARSDIHLEQGEYDEALSRLYQLHYLMNEEGDEVEVAEIVNRITSLNVFLGSRAVQENRLPDAIPYFRQALEAQPDTVYHYTNLAYIYSETDQPGMAVEVIDKALERFPDETELLMIQATLLSDQGDAAALEGVMRELVAREQGNIDLTANYISLLLHNQQFDEANRLTEEMLANESLGKERFSVLVDAFEQAGFSQGKAGILERYAETYPELAEVRFELAEIYIQTGDTEKAEEILGDLTEEGYFEEVTELLSEIYLADGNYDKAMQLYNELIGANPDHISAYWKKAQVQQYLELWTESAETLREINRLTSDNRYRYEWAFSMEMDGNQDDALQMYTELAENGYFHPRMFLILAEHNEMISGLGEGCSLYENAFGLVLRQTLRTQEQVLQEFQSGDGTQLTSRLPGDADLEMLSDVSHGFIDLILTECSESESEQFMSNLLRQYGHAGQMQLLAASYYRDRGDHARSLQHAKRSAELTPHLAEAHFYLAELLEAENRMDDAALSYERALSADPFLEEAYSALLRIYRNSNRLNELCDRWKLRHRTNRDNQVLEEYLYEALIRAGRWDEAGELRDGS